MAENSDVFLGDCAFTLGVVDVPWDQAAVTYSFFIYERDQWWITGGQDLMGIAELTQTGAYTILRGRGVFGLYDRQGSYIGLADGERVVIGDGKGISAVLEEGPYESDEALGLVVRTLHFLVK